ncbi:MAG: CBS domain-containing protein [Candidatus Woesearchaeota archaeon]
MEIEISQIKNIRKKLEITQSELAKLSGVSQSMIAKIERGKIDPSLSIFKRITNAITELQKKNSIKAYEIMNKKIIYASEGETTNSIIKKMLKHGISQVPIFKGKKCIGLITESQLLKVGSKQLKAKDVMGECPPTIPKDTPIENLMGLIEYSPLILVVENGSPIGIITKNDIIKGMLSYSKKQGKI